MKRIVNFYIILLCFISVSYKAFSQGGYILIFGENLNNELLTLNTDKKGFFLEKKITIDKSIGIEKDFIFFDSTYFNSKLTVNLKSKKKCVKVSLSPTKEIVYVYVWYYNRRLSLEIRKTPLELQ